MKLANKIENAVVYDDLVILPDGVMCLTVKLNADSYWDDYKGLPDALEVNGLVLGKTGFNSDTMIAYFRSDKALAYKV